MKYHFTFLLKGGITLLVALFINLFPFNNLNAQCSGNVTLSTQAQVIAFDCTTFTGNLTISGNDIVDLDVLADGSGQNLTNISGSISVSNCPNLTSIQGLDLIETVTGNFTLSNLPSLTTFGLFTFQLQSIGSFFQLSNLPLLSSVGFNLANLNHVQVLSIAFDTGITDYSGFNSISSISTLEFFGLSQSTVNAPFLGITELDWFIFNSNAATSFTGLSNLTKVTPNSGAINTTGRFQIQNNSNLSNFTMNSGFNSAGALAVTGNPNLSSCCFLLPILDSNPSPVEIFGNSLGCSSVAQIDAPPALSACPANITVSANASSCEAMQFLSSPTVTDCDLDLYVVDFIGGNGTNFSNHLTTSGQAEIFSVSPPINYVTYRSEDLNGNISTCQTIIHVEDNTAPVLSNIPSDVTINCNDPFPSIPSPLVTDNCDVATALSATSSVSMGTCMLGEPAEIHAYTWTATDSEGNSTSEDWTVTRISDFSFDLGGSIAVCDGSSYVIDPGNIGSDYAWSTGATSNAVSVSASGTYSLTVTTANGCCYVDEVDLSFVSPPDAVANGSVLSCGATSTTITGLSATTGASYSWTGPGGFTSMSQNPAVSSIGDYILTVTSPEGCTSTATATVTADTDLPDASASGGILNCTATSVQLMGSSSSSGVTYSWTGPSGFASDMQNPMVTEAGIYTLSVSGSNGCIVTADAEVMSDILPPTTDLDDGELSCTVIELAYSVEGTASWSGPDGFTSSMDSITIIEPGTYNVTVTGANTCSTTASLNISQDNTIPDINAEGGVVNCASGQATLSGSSSSPGATYSWTGPGGFTASIPEPLAATLGTYTLVVTGENGCTASVDVELTASLDAPEIMATGGTVDCIASSIELTASSSTENISFTWIGPEGFTSEMQNPMVTLPGIYTVTGTNDNGCSSTATTEVVDNTLVPDVSISAENINCQLGSTQFTTIVSENVTSYMWSGPNEFSSTEKEPEVTVEGMYTLIVTSENGCTATATTTLISDVENPDAMASGGLLTCTLNNLVIEGSTTTDGAVFMWTGPNNFTSSIQNPEVSVPGTYFFTVTAPNGCTAIDSAIVEGDSDLPIANATGGTINCINDQVTLIGSTESTGATTVWTGPNGFSSSNLTPIVDIPGTYTFTVTSTGSCSAFSSVEVILDKRDPDLAIAGGRVDCNEGSREFDLVTNALDGNFSWIGPDGFTSSIINPSYTMAGTYMVTVTGTNGCFTSGTFEVDHDVNYESNLSISGNDASMEITGGTPPFTIVYDDNIVGAEAIDLSQGDHFVEIIDGLGCKKLIEFTIMSTSVYDEEEIGDIKLYPNPVLHEIVVDWNDSNMEAKTLTILSLGGQVIKTNKVEGRNTQVINTEELQAGIYYLKIEGEEGPIFMKFLKM